MSSNSLDDEDGSFVVLSNDEEQYSLWPNFAAVPRGWTVVFGGHDGTDRSSALRYVEDNWTDMRTRSLRTIMSAGISDSSQPS